MHAEQVNPLARPLRSWSGTLLAWVVAPCLMGAAALCAQAPQALPPVRVDGAAVLRHLTLAIGWYGHSTTDIPAAGVFSEAVYRDNAQALGAQVVQLAFQSAKAEAALIAEQKGGGILPSADTAQRQNLATLQATAAARVQQLQAQLAGLDTPSGRAQAGRQGSLAASREDLQGQLELQQAMLDAIQKMAEFEASNSEIAGGLEGGIYQLARSIPEVLRAAPGPGQAAVAAPPAKAPLASSGGLISESMTLYDCMSAEHQITGVIKETRSLGEVANRLRTPLRDALRATIQQSQQLADQPPAKDSRQLQGDRQTFQELTGRFKLLSAAVLPLSQEMIVLGESGTNAGEWRAAIASASLHVLRSVVVRALGIAVALALILVLSEVWRRITFGFVSEPRRRRQFLVLRRVAVGFLIVIVLTLGFVSEFSSLVTFAGFITAGIAVGLQAVLLSVAAYFFIIGRYGIRVGDRISIAGITGDVVDIGLVRLYLMELAGTGVDAYATGRIVVFSNAVLFQASTPLYKQIPGTEYAWRELVAGLARDGNHQAAQEKLAACVEAVFEGYRERLQWQHVDIERRIDAQVGAPHPVSRLQFTAAGLELLVRYPVELRKAQDTDAEMTRAVLGLMETDPVLKAELIGFPCIRAAAKG